MGCVSSTLLNQDDDFTQLGSTGFGNHIVSLTSSTYGLLTLDPPRSSSSDSPIPTPPRFTLGSLFPSPLRSDQPEVINSWELMDGLDNDSFRFSPLPPLSRPSTPKIFSPKLKSIKENFNPNRPLPTANASEKRSVFKLLSDKVEPRPSSGKYSLDGFEKLCPPNGENKVVIYTTTLRGVRKTFEACNAVRSAIEGLGVVICERDISMDRGFREELRELMRGKESNGQVPPRVFVKGRYLGGAEEVLKMHEEGCLGELLDGLPKVKVGGVCDGCGGVRFLPCFQCNGSCKLVMVDVSKKQGTVVVRCPDCNENGLVLCPICS